MRIWPLASILLLWSKDSCKAFRTTQGISISISQVNQIRSYRTTTTICSLAKKKRNSKSKLAAPPQQDSFEETSEDTATDYDRQLNRRERLDVILERDGPNCVWCQTPLLEFTTATTDHLIPKVKGGPSWIENEVAACPKCNKTRGHTMPTEWMEDCRAKGWQPSEDVVVQCLTQLDQAILKRGGQRKARPHLAKQLKKLGLISLSKK